MKTSNMDYEKKYKEAIERLKQWDREHPDGYVISDRDEFIFPELAESDDERIRKALMQNLKERFGTKGNMGEGLDMPKVLAWLEKQGEQKPVEMSRVEDSQYYYNIHRILEGLKYNDNYGRTAIDAAINWFDSIKNFGYTKWSKEDEELLNLLCGRLIYSNIQEKDKFVMWLGKLTPIEQNPAWSEEDEKNLQGIIDEIEANRNHAPGYDIATYDRFLSWLKSLRPQNRCTYNPYKEVVESIAEMCEKYEDANLDSLKDFYSNVKVKCKDAKEYDSLFPQSTWQPSKEQMKALNTCIMQGEISYVGQGTELQSLYNDLKKLTE